MSASPAGAAQQEAPAADGRDEPALVGLRRSSTFFPELESLRGIAVSLVVAFHLDTFVHFPVPPPDRANVASAFVRAGHTGVDLFFVLSGFLLALPFLADVAGGRRVSVGHYFARRALRILPLYWAAVVVGTLLHARHVRDLAVGVPHLVFLTAVPALAQPIVPYGAVWWSLSTEIQFYLVLPLLLLLRGRAGRIALALVLLVYGTTYVALIRGHVRLSVLNQIALHNSLFGRGPLFLGGMVAAAIHLRWGPRLRGRLAGVGWLRRGGADAVLLALLAAMGVFLEWLVGIGRAQQAYTTQWWHWVNAALWASLLLLLLLAPLRTKRLFCNPVLDRLGVLSYSIYMIHAPFLFLLLAWVRGRWPGTFDGWGLSTCALVAPLVLVCVALSSVTYRVVERPFLVRKARIDD